MVQKPSSVHLSSEKDNHIPPQKILKLSGWRRRLRTIRQMSRRSILITMGLFLILLAVVGSIGGTFLEENDKFCTSCHLAAERTYYNRSQIAMVQQQDVPDLASFHYVAALNDPQMNEFRCVDCHRGRQNIPHRVVALVVGFYDGLVYLTGGGSPDEIQRGDVHQAWLIEASCINCHADTLLTLGFNNHYHNYLPAVEKAFDLTGDLFVEEGLDFEQERELILAGIQPQETDITCLTCHVAHVSVIGGTRVQFVQTSTRDRGCTQCHRDNDLNIDLIPEEAD